MTSNIKPEDGPMQSDWTIVEEIASRDLNNLYRTSTLFQDRDRYRAFCAYYSVMRVVDDRIDGLPTRLGLSTRERRAEHRFVSIWDSAVASCYSGHEIPRAAADTFGLTDAQHLLNAFADSLEVIRPPELLWRRFFLTMHWDLDHARFRTWGEFLDYADGASVAPTTIYLYLIAAERGPKGGRVPPGFDIMECGRHLGRFAYIGHIVRDLSKDLQVGDQGLLYIPLEEMAAFGVTENLLFSDLRRGRASRETRLLLAELVERARTELAKGRSLLTSPALKLDEDRKLILALIVGTYERILDKIQECDFDVMGNQHRLTNSEKESLLSELAEWVHASAT